MGMWPYPDTHASALAFSGARPKESVPFIEPRCAQSEASGVNHRAERLRRLLRAVLTAHTVAPAIAQVYIPPTRRLNLRRIDPIGVEGHAGVAHAWDATRAGQSRKPQGSPPNHVLGLVPHRRANLRDKWHQRLH